MMKKITTLYVTMLLAFLLPVNTAAQPSQLLKDYCTSHTAQYDEAVTFIVEVEGDPLLTSESAIDFYSESTTEQNLLKKQTQVMSSIKSSVSPEAKKGFVYTALFNGFSLEAKRSQMDELRALPGVKNVYISSHIPAPQPMMSTAGQLTNAEYSYSCGYKGEGQVIAVIDIGLDANHEFFASEPVNPRYSREDIDAILKNHTLNSGTSSANQVYRSKKIPYAYSYATNSADTYISGSDHGTHVAGIAVGKNGSLPDGEKFSGIAPEAQLMFFNCGTERSLTDECIFAALNDAALLGADVINMSFGTAFTNNLFSGAFDTLFDNAKNAGISLIVAAGNEARGFNSDVPQTKNIDYSTAGTPGCLSQPTSVASANNIATNPVNCWKMQLADNTEFQLHSAYDGSTFLQLFEENQYIEFADCAYGYVSDYSDIEVSGKIALVKRGEISFDDKIQNAYDAGAIGIIISNNIPNEVFSCAGNNLTLLPAAVSTLETYELLSSISDGHSMTHIGDGYFSFPMNDPGQLSPFSSWGLNGNMDLKPEITAPGGSIYSSVPGGEYSHSSGTSMASPHMAGITALARQYYDTDPFLSAYNDLAGSDKVMLIENIAMNSADIIKQDSNGIPFSPRLQGAGMVNIERMIKSRVLLEGSGGKAKLNLGDQLDESLPLSFSITNISDQNVVFDKISVQVLTDGYTQNNDQYIVDESVGIDIVSSNIPASITVLPGETYDFQAEITLDIDFLTQNSAIFTNGFYIDGYVILENNSDSELKASLPFSGFYGNWGDAPIFDSTIYDENGSTLSYPTIPAFSGTFLSAAFDNGSFFVLGQNLFNNEVIDKKYIAYASKSFDLLLNFQLYRSALPVRFSLTNEQSEQVYSSELVSTAPKYYPNRETISSSEFSDLDDGNYTLTLEATLAYNDATDTLTLPFVIDNMLPQITGASYNAENMNITITAQDNHYVECVYVQYTDEDGSSKFLYELIDNEQSAPGGSISKTIDISSVPNPENILVGCMDFAGNEITLPQSHLTTNIGVNLISHTTLYDMTSALMNVRNNGENSENVRLFLVFYSPSDKIIAVATKEIALAAGEDRDIRFSLIADTQSATYAKAYVWSKNIMMPLSPVITFPLDSKG